MPATKEPFKVRKAQRVRSTITITHWSSSLEKRKKKWREDEGKGLKVTTFVFLCVCVLVCSILGCGSSFRLELWSWNASVQVRYTQCSFLALLALCCCDKSEQTQQKKGRECIWLLNQNERKISQIVTEVSLQLALSSAEQYSLVTVTRRQRNSKNRICKTACHFSFAVAYAASFSFDSFYVTKAKYFSRFPVVVTETDPNARFWKQQHIKITSLGPSVRVPHHH